MDKKLRRLRRARKTRSKILELGCLRLSVHRTNQHIYAQIIDGTRGLVLASASTVESDVKNEIGSGSNIKAATAIGKRIAERAKLIGLNQVSFDRSGFAYHGRVKALAEAAREHGLQF